MTLRSGRARGLHSVRFTGDDMPKYKSLDGDGGAGGPAREPDCGSPVPGGGSPAPGGCGYTPAAQRLRLNEQRMKLLAAVTHVVAERAELEAGRGALAARLAELRAQLRRRQDDHQRDKKDRLKALRGANQRLERDKCSLLAEAEHLRRHLHREEAHHLQHARTAVAQAIQGVVCGAGEAAAARAGCSLADLPGEVSRSVARHKPSRLADNKLAAARLMRDIAELRQRVAQVEARLAHEMKRKRAAELDIVRLRKELSATKSCVAALRVPPPLHRDKCSKFA